MTERIEAKVAGVLSRRELALNKGDADGVEVGMRFAILNGNGIGLTDPDTGEPLGSVEVPKTIVKVVRLDGDHLAVARTFRTLPGTGTVGMLAGLTSGSPARLETLRLGEAPLREEMSEEDSIVKRGDVAIQTFGDEFDDFD